MSHNAALSDDDLTARSHEWRRTGDPSVLWPGVAAHALTKAAEAIEVCVALGLDGRRSSLGRADGADARAIGIAALVLGVGPLLGYWVERGLLDVSAGLAGVLDAHLTHGRARLARIVDGVRPALQALSDAGARPVVIKGLHSAHACFPDPGVRPFADVDVVVRPAAIAEAERVLASLGYEAGDAYLSFKREWLPPGVDRRIRSFELWHRESPWTLELHSGLVFSDQHRYGVNFGEAPVVGFEVAGVAVHALAAPLRLVTTAAHCSSELAAMRLLRLVEMILMIRARGEDTVDWATVHEVIDRSGTARFLYPSFTMIEVLAPGTVPAHILDRVRRSSSRLARHVVARLRPATPVLPGGSLAERLMWVSRPGEFLYRLRQLAVPSVHKSWAETYRAYQGRLRRLATGKASLGFRP